MTGEELERHANQRVRLIAGGRTLVGKLIVGFEAQIGVKAPYAIQWYDVNPTLGTREERLTAIPHPEAIDSIEVVDESARDEIKDEAKEDQTPG
ncbi:MAG TPA: hypothetical protein VGI19_02570 [Candidatus Cybelea sp.]